MEINGMMKKYIKTCTGRKVMLIADICKHNIRIWEKTIFLL